MNTTVNSNAAQAFGVFGSLPVPAGDWNTAAFFVTRKRAFAESALRIRKAPLARCLSYPVGVALSGYDWLRAPRRRAQGKAQISYNFDPRFDAFWRRLSRASPALLAVRSRALLDWHFAASLARNHLWIITVEKNGELEAYGILQRRDEPQYGLTRMRLVDFQALKSHDEHCRTIVSAALHECATRGIQVLEHVGCGLNQTRILDEWAPHRRKLPSWAFFYKASNPALAERLAAPHAWQPSSYDGDSSL